MAKILVVDDELEFREMLEILFKREGHQVELLTDGSDLVNGKIPLADIDLILVDIFMPEVEGMQILRYLQTHWPGKKIIAMSGGGRDMGASFFLTLALNLGAAYAFEKPFALEELMLAVNSLLAQEQVSA